MLSKDLDKFYTNDDVAELCATIYFKHVNKSEEIVEPSAGAGAFAPYVSIMLDIMPEASNIQQADFLQFDSGAHKYYLGNPPFGKNSSLAKKFFNHAAKGKGFIGFILPRTFRKVSIQNAIDLNFWLVDDILLPENSFTLEGKQYSVPCIFQVWEHRSTKREKVTLPTTHRDFSFVTKTQADFSIRRVGGNAGKVNPHNDFSESSNYFIKGGLKDDFIDLEKDFIEAAKNTAGNPSLAKSELIYLYTNRK